MHNIVIGIDIGTSYTKGITRLNDGTVLAKYRIKSSIFKDENDHRLIKSTELWGNVKKIIKVLLSKDKTNKLRIVSLCISAISPTLTVFDTQNLDNAYSILYSTLIDHVNDFSIEQSDSILTKNRLVVLKAVAIHRKFKKPVITDLVGYVNWRLTNEFTINSLSLSLMGISNNENFCVVENVIPRVVAVLDNIGEITESTAKEIGVEAGIPVCGGCPDTMGSVVGSGMKFKNEEMIYLGTFGSLLKLERDVDVLLNSKEINKTPFNWLLSVPDFGPTIELLSSNWFGLNSNTKNMQALDKLAKNITPGANGLLFLLPRWKNAMIPVGKFTFLPTGICEHNIEDMSRAALESIAYAIRLLLSSNNEVIYVSGGGAQSKIWLDIISMIIKRKIIAFDDSWEAIGTSDIAAKMIWGNKFSRYYYISNTEINLNEIQIDNNYKIIKKYYYANDWL